MSMRSMRHGYTNDTRSDGSIVVKRYEGLDRSVRFDTERAMLVRLAGHLPVPHLVAASAGALHMEHIDGVHGQELVAAGYGAQVLHSCGQILRRVQSIDVATAFPDRRNGVLVHGDFGPNNLLFDPDTFAVTAILDWEWAHPGDFVEDLAWCEWIIRMHHPAEIAALEALFTAYGSRPPWQVRHGAMIRKCRSMLDMHRIGDSSATGVTRWHRRIDITLAWTEF